MKILITVGTTPYDKLIYFCDKNLDPSLDILMQISNKAAYIPKRFDYFKFTDDILSCYNISDLIITHAGAGTIFKLLEMRKLIIVCPNLERDDGHQKDIASHVYLKNWGIVCWNFKELPNLIDQAADFQITQYERKEFSGGPFIDKVVQDLYFKNAF